MNNIISIITSSTFLIALKIIFIAIGVFFFFGIILLLLRNSWLKRRILEDLIEIISYRPFGAKKAFKQWGKISKKVESGKEADYKMALIEADSLLADILKKMGYKGDNMREILEQIDARTLPNIESVWRAHKVRNNIVHDPDYDLSRDEARRNLQIYEQAFRDLEMF